MTEPQATFLTFLLSNKSHYLAKKKNFNGRQGYMIYLPKQHPQRWFQANAVTCFLKKGILKSEGEDFHRADRKKIRALHGRSLIKKLYKRVTNTSIVKGLEIPIAAEENSKIEDEKFFCHHGECAGKDFCGFQCAGCNEWFGQH